MSKQLTYENLLGQFPNSMAEEDAQYALASSISAELIKLYNSHDMLAIYARIDELDETLLDILANDFHIDWWDFNAPIEEKRDMFKNSWNIHRMKGTKEAVELFLSSAFKNATISEWFEYGGLPYHFKIDVCDKKEEFISGKAIGSFMNTLEKVKNKRSILEAIYISTDPTQDTTYHSGDVAITGKVTVPFDASSVEDDTIYSPIRHANAVAITSHASVPVQKYRTYEEIKSLAYSGLQDMTYEQILFKEEYE